MKRKSLLLSFLFITSFSAAQHYINYAASKPVKTSWESKNLQRINDGNLATGSLKGNPKGEIQWVEIDLTAEFKIGGMHLYLDNSGILPARNFSFQIQQDGRWEELPGFTHKDNFDDKLTISFPDAISMSAIRFLTDNETTFGIVEWQLWGRDVPLIPHDLEIEVPEKFQAKEHWVCVNQVAYNWGQPKGFTVPTAKSDLAFLILEKSSGKVVYKGQLKDGKGDFTDFNPHSPRETEYMIRVEGDDLPPGESFPFGIWKHAIQETAYRSTVEFFNDARSMVGSHPSAYGGTAWRDGCYYTYEVPSLVLLYLSNPTAFDTMPVTLNWQAEKERVLSSDFRPTKEANDKDALTTVRAYYSNISQPQGEDIPDIIQNIRFGTAWNLIDPISHDPSGDVLGERMHSQTIEQFAYFLYGYPAYRQYISEDFYQMVLDSTLQWWSQSGLFEVITTVGNPKGRHCPGHSILPNLLMYEVAKREKLNHATQFMAAAQAQTKWIIEEADWHNPAFTKGQRISEHKLITGLATFLLNYPDQAPEGLEKKLIEWAEVAVSHSNNLWDFRRFDLEENWTLPGYNEVGNIIAFPACALSVAMALEDETLKSRLEELAFSHFDNFSGRNPQNAHCANHPELGFEGIEKGWPYGDPRRDICARLEHVRGSLSSLPGSEMYPFNPNGRPRHGEGWTAYNAGWNVSLAFLNFYEGISSVQILKDFDQKIPSSAYELAWSDEFNSSRLNETKWAYRTDNKHRSKQLKENVSVQNGALVLDLNVHEQSIEGKNASGAGIVSKRRFQYGYYEVRTKLGDGIDEDKDGKTDEGWHHAFWAMAASLNDQGEVNTTYPGIRRTEIDCFENSSEHQGDHEQNGLHRFTQHVIIWDENGKEWGRLPKPPRDLTRPKNFNPHQWHTYGFEWTEKEIHFYVDGKLTKTADYPSHKFTHDQINVWLTAIAANWNENDQEKSQAQYDYFRFYKRKTK